MAHEGDVAAEELKRFLTQLRELKQAGSPSYSDLRARMPSNGTPADSTLSYLFGGKHKRAPDWDLVEKVVKACVEYACGQNRRGRSGIRWRHATVRRR